MGFNILINPAAGKMSKDQKYRLMEEIASHLGPDCAISGLDTACAEEFQQCARQLTQDGRTLIVASGDGGFNDVINAVHPEASLAVIPIGSGNVMRSVLDLPRSPHSVAELIRIGENHSIDLIECNGQRTLFSSVGIEGMVIDERERYLGQGIKGLTAYAGAAVKSLWNFTRTDMKMDMDGNEVTVPHALTTIVTKVPYYGYGMKVVPKAQMHDGVLHVLTLNGSMPSILYAIATSNGSAKEFNFRVIRDGLKMRY